MERVESTAQFDKLIDEFGIESLEILLVYAIGLISCALLQLRISVIIHLERQAMLFQVQNSSLI